MIEGFMIDDVELDEKEKLPGDIGTMYEELGEPYVEPPAKKTKKQWRPRKITLEWNRNTLLMGGPSFTWYERVFLGHRWTPFMVEMR